VNVAQSPDIILFLTDDHAPWSIGCYGNADANTPNLDRLATTGVRFNRQIGYKLYEIRSTGNFPSQ